MPTPGFSHKVWKDQPDHTTPISATALEDLEDRVTQFALDTAATLSNSFKGVWSSGTAYSLGNGVSVGTNNYISTVAGTGTNTNHNPVGDDGSHWVPLIPSSVLSVGSPKFATIVLTPSGSDDSAQINTAITALSGSGDVVLGPGTFLLNSAVLTMPRNAAGLRIRGAGKGITILKPAATTVRAIDFPYVADGDTYQNITLQDFSIDGSLLSLPAGANQSLIGNLINGSRSHRVNFANIDCRRITVTGVPVATSSGFQYQVFAFGSTQGGTTVAAGSTGVNVSTFAGAGTLNVVTTTGYPTSGQLKVQTSAGFATLSYTNVGGTTFTGVNLVAGSGTLTTGNLVMEATQNTMTGFTFEDLTVLGGNDGFVVIADRISGSTNVGTNHYIDEINWTRCYHDCGVTPVASVKPGGGQVGGSAQGGTYRVHDCTFKNAGDCYEFDGMQALYVTNTIVEDCVNGIFANNFNTPLNPQSQTAIFDKVHLRIVKMQPTTSFSAAGVQLGPTASQYTGFNTLGHAILRDCTFVSYAPNAAGANMFIGAGGRYVSKITIQNATASHEGMADTTVGGAQARYMGLAPLSSCQITIRGLKFAMTGSTTDASLQLQPVFLGTFSTSSAANLVLDIDDTQFYYNLSGVTAGNVQLITIGVMNGGTTTSTFQGIISRQKFLPSTGDNSGKAIALPTAATYPISTTQSAGLVVRDCDFSSGRSGGFDVILSDKAGNQPRVFYYNNKWGVNGPQSGVGRNTANAYFAATSFTTATGNQYVGGFSATLYISGGVNVTAVDVSRNGGSNYENRLTQAAAAIPATIEVRVDNGDFLKLTFTTTAPTVVVVPDK